ncbi:MAG: hypothetical protein NC094_01435 [Bacteroidales bacterium]|nr:hypothetical protein [Lachnoclostridium sp.]MCM1384513.1 hypothetical protein [Lachnoclostridium sp.]MCM1464057.1 hypothetical protein [Bacteroidales bacterium]
MDLVIVDVKYERNDLGIVGAVKGACLEVREVKKSGQDGILWARVYL